MFPRSLFIIFFYYLACLCNIGLCGQPIITASAVVNQQKPATQDPLFDDDQVLKFKLTGRLNVLFNDRDLNPIYHPLLLQYKLKDSTPLNIRVQVRTRGNFRRRRGTCSMPPLMLNFSTSGKQKNDVFEKQHKLKLVVPCRGDEFVIREWLVYKLYNLVTEKSFKARLALVEFEDSLKKRKPETHYCILLEDESSLAKRNKSTEWDKTGVAMKSTDRDQFLKMAVFQFMIGNTDWSVPYLQNIKMIKDSVAAPYTIPYDFDHAGIVSAPYALPAEQLQLSSVLERSYRGYCEADKKNFAEVFVLFNKLKDRFNLLYLDCKILNPKYVKFVTKYLNDFYNTINNDKAVEKEFKKPCYESTRIEIKGLKVR